MALIDNSNAVFTYDAIGNPLSDGTWTYTWEKGHQLKSMHDVNTGITLEYKYNQNGIHTQRIKKINDVVYETTDFILDGKRVIALQSDDTTIYFIYDSISNLVGFNTNGNSYSYLKNLQGDIVGIIGAALLMFDESSEGIYHARPDCWQQFFGYNDLYDVGFDIGTLMQREKTSFTHGGLQYTFWAWKGDYINLRAGAELGIYMGSGVHKQAATSMSMPMTISLTYENQEIINYSMNTWWMMGFNSEYRNVRPEDLSVVFTVDFSKNTEMFSSFYTQNQDTVGWSFNQETYTASFSF